MPVSHRHAPAHETTSRATPPLVTARGRVRGILLLIQLNTLRLALQHLGSPDRAFKALRQLEKKRAQYFGKAVPQKLARVDGRYFWTLEAPGWPGRALDEMVSLELERVQPRAGAPRPLRLAFLAVTKKCPLACEHCYDWHNHNRPEGLSLEDLVTIMRTLQERRVSQIFLSGGEPLVRYKDLLTLLKSARAGTDFWLLTSGHGLTAERAAALKAAGLVGVSISIDHFDPAEHDRFRGLTGAFDRALAAAENVRRAGLVLSLSLCATKQFTTSENLMRYAALARQLGAAFIQILDPRAAGRYRREDVALSDEQTALLDELYLRMNFDERYKDWPIVAYHGYHQRRVGCSGAGDRFLYVDGDGDVHACPFCQKAHGNVLMSPLEDSLAALSASGCMAYERAAI